MKKLIIASAILASTVAVSGGSSVQAAAANPASATVNCQNGTGNLSFAGQVGDTFEVTNSYGGGPCDIIGLAGKATPSGQGYSAGMNDGYVMSNGLPATFTITGAGTFTLSSGGGALYNVTVVIGGGGASGPATVVKGSFDPNGGECVFDGQKKTSAHDVFVIGYMYAPGNDECARPQCVHVGWNVSSSALTPVPANLPLLQHGNSGTWRHFVATSGDFVADWVQAPKFSDISLPTNGSTNLRWDSGCRGVVRFDAAGACRLSVGQSFQSGTSSIVTAEGSMWIFVGSQAGSCEITATPVFTAYQNLDGTLPVSTPPPTLPSSTFTVTVEVPPSERSIDIIGERTTVSGKTGICVSGSTTGIAAGDTVVPYVRFPGGEYTQGSARPVVGADGSFEWCRKTGKKTYVYFTASDGSVRSNRIIIPAN